MNLVKWLRGLVATRRKRWARRIIAEGREKFGPKWCPICSFAMHVGHCDPEPHDCPREEEETA